MAKQDLSSISLKRKLASRTPVDNTWRGFSEWSSRARAYVLLMISLSFFALATVASAQWFPPAVKVDGTLFTNATGVPSSGAISSYTKSSGSSLTIRFDGTDYLVVCGPSFGSYTPSTHTFSVGSLTINGVDTDETAWPPSTSAGGPPAVWVNGSVWPLTSSTGGIDTYTSSTGKTLSITSGAFVISASGDTTLDSVGGTYENGVLYTGNNAVDVRPVATNGVKLTPTYGPTYGHPGELVADTLWQFRGTHTSGGVTFDIYSGNQAGQSLKIGEDWFALVDSQDANNNVTGSFNGLFFAGTTPVNIKPINADGRGGLENSTFYWADAFYVNGSPKWSKYADVNGFHYYAGQAGQLLRIDAVGTIQVVDGNLSESGVISESGGVFNGLTNFSLTLSNSFHTVLTDPMNDNPSIFYVDGVKFTFLNGSYSIYEYNGYAVEIDTRYSYVGEDGGFANFYTFPRALDFWSPSRSKEGNYDSSGFFENYYSSPYAILINGVDYYFQIAFTDEDYNQVKHFRAADGGYFSTIGSNEYAEVLGYDSLGRKIVGSVVQGIFNAVVEIPPVDGVNNRSNPIFGGVTTIIGGVEYTFSHGEDIYDSLINNYSSRKDYYVSANNDVLSVWTNRSQNPLDEVIYGGMSGSHPVWGNFYGDTPGSFQINTQSRSTPFYEGQQIWLNGRKLVFSQSVLHSNGTVSDTYSVTGYLVKITGPYEGECSVAITTPTGSSSALYAYNAHSFFGMTDIYLSAYQEFPIYGPPAVWVEGSVWYLQSASSGDLYVNDAGETLLITGTSGQPSTVTINATSLSPTPLSGTYASGLFQVTALDIRPRNADGSFYVPTAEPAYGGPAAFWVNGHIWKHQGSIAAHGDLYVGDQPGQLLWLKTGSLTLSDDALSFESVTATYSDILTVVTNTANVSINVIPIEAVGFSPVPSEGHPPAVWLQGDFLAHMGGTDGYDHYLSATTGAILSISLDETGAVYVSGDDLSVPGGTFVQPLFFMVGNRDVRSRNADNTFLVPTTSPAKGPAQVSVNAATPLWKYQGTADHAAHTFDEYVGEVAGQILWIRDDGQVTGFDTVTNQAITASFGNHTFANVQGATLSAHNADGSAIGPRYAPGSVMINDQPWTFTHNLDDTDYYAGPSTGQVLSIGPNGAVNYTNPALGIVNRPATYANGQFVGLDGDGGTNPGGGYNGGPIVGDLDVKGNIFSLGSWIDDPEMAGLTLEYGDDVLGSASIMLTSSRPSTDWWWSRADSESPGATVTVMKLDESHRLNLYSPLSGIPAIVLDPAGTSRFSGAVRIEPQGDLEMGDFTATPEQP